ncbi:MAG: hypothetical protein V5A34_05825 [Halapricum sp.]
MVEQQVDEALMKADRWSKVIALFFAMGTYGLAILLTSNNTFNASVAAFAGIGVRLYIPYHASVSGYGGEQVPSQAHSATGNYHHGAVGAGLVVGSFLALGIMIVEPTYWTALIGGVAGGIVSFLVLRSTLPS